MGRPAKQKEGKKRKRGEEDDERREEDTSKSHKRLERRSPRPKRRQRSESPDREEISADNLSQQSRSENEYFQLKAAEENEFNTSTEEDNRENEVDEEDQDEFPEETVTTPVMEEGEQTPAELEETEVSLKKKGKKEENRKSQQMMRDLEKFFEDEGKLSKMWNLVKAINTSDEIQKEKTNRDKVSTPGTSRQPEVAKTTGNRVGIDITRLGRASKSAETLYSARGRAPENPQVSPHNGGEESLSSETSPEQVTSSEEISPVSDEEKRLRLPPPPFIPLPPPPAREGGRSQEGDDDDQPGPSGWTAPATDRVKRTRKQSKELLDQAVANRTEAAKPAGESDIHIVQSQHIIASLRDKGSDLSVLLESLNAFTSHDDFDPLTVQLDKVTLEKVGRGAYVDLRRLLPKESLGDDDEEEMHWVMQEGTPKLKKKNAELQPITGFRKWMTAFSAYSRLYTKSNPERAPEMHQYLMDIQEATSTYTWDSIYAYDKIFRMYMEQKPWHDWGTPYTKYWNKTLKKKEVEAGSARRGFGSRTKKKPCWRFNKTGTCDRKDCEFDNCCQVCGRFGHWKGTCYHNKEVGKRQENREVKGTKSGNKN